jgi:3-oxoadipate enol-lactonase
MPIASVGGIDLHYEIAGQGEPLLFIHGLGSCSQDWQLQRAHFSQYYRVITFDLRSHGLSTKPPGPYSIALFASDTAGLLETLEITTTHMVGISLGGMIAFQLAVAEPKRVKSLVIVNSGPAVPADTFKQRLPLYQRLLIISLLGLRRMGKILAKRLFPKPEQEALRRTFVERLAANDKAAYLASLKAIFGWSVTEHLGGIHCPALVISADEDYTPVALKEAYVAAMPNARLTVIPDSRHALPLEKPREFNEALEHFLRQLASEETSSA